MAIDFKDTDQLKELYENYPYPGKGPMPPARELVNFYKLYRAENPLNESGLSILDVGVGSGNRLLELVREFPNNAYTAIDYSEASLANAESLFLENGIKGVSFKLANLEEDLSALGKFDVIFCMGVVHHLRNPRLALTNISRVGHDNSMFTFYVYGELGSQERIRRKHILEKLAGTDQGIAWFDWVRRCDFGELPYGWRDLGDGLSLYFDAYKNPQEELYDLAKILDLFAQSTHHWSRAAIHGWISNGAGYLVDADAQRPRLPVKSTTLKPLSTDAVVQTRFTQLPLIERLRLLELIYLPEAYTVSAWGASAFAALPEDGRLQRSAFSLDHG